MKQNWLLDVDLDFGQEYMSIFWNGCLSDTDLGHSVVQLEGVNLVRCNGHAPHRVYLPILPLIATFPPSESVQEANTV